MGGVQRNSVSGACTYVLAETKSGSAPCFIPTTDTYCIQDGKFVHLEAMPVVGMLRMNCEFLQVLFREPLKSPARRS